MEEESCGEEGETEEINMMERKGKGEGAGPKGGCYVRRGAHYQAQCPQTLAIPTQGRTSRQKGQHPHRQLDR